MNGSVVSGTDKTNGATRRGAREPDFIEITGAREHNLAIDSLRIPKRQMVVFTGPSGSGKSSLAFDTLYAEGQRRYVETLSAYARQFLGQLERPKVDHLRGLSPTIAIEQKSASSNPRSTVGTITEIQHQLGDCVRSTLHVHLDHDHCMEVIVLRGRSDELQRVAERLLATRGVKQGGVQIVADVGGHEPGDSHTRRAKRARAAARPRLTG